MRVRVRVQSNIGAPGAQQDSFLMLGASQHHTMCLRQSSELVRHTVPICPFVEANNIWKKKLKKTHRALKLINSDFESPRCRFFTDPWGGSLISENKSLTAPSWGGSATKGIDHKFGFFCQPPPQDEGKV